MKRIILLLVLLPSPSIAQRTIFESNIGCRDRVIMERMFALVEAQDRQAYDDFVDGRVASGECRALKQGEKVRIVEGNELMECLAPWGSSGLCMWTPEGITRP